MTLFFTLFIAGVLTILLPCILPLIPIVLGVSIAGRSRLRPLLTVTGMVVSFVGFTFLLLVVLNQFVEAADYLRIATYYLLLLFGVGFIAHTRIITFPAAIVGGLFFGSKGFVAVAIAMALGVIAMEIGGRVASSIQSFGGTVQQDVRQRFGQDAPLTAFLMGLTMGLVWVPCAGPALSFALTLVRDEPGLTALIYLTAYGLGTAIPLLLIGYGGQYAVHSVHALTKYTGVVKKISGFLLIFTALAFQLQWFTTIETWIVNRTPFGSIGTTIEQRLFGDHVGGDIMPTDPDLRSPATMSDNAAAYPKLARAPAFTGLGPWHSTTPLTPDDLRGKVVLVDFWTYSCINCIRTLPYIQGYWDKYGVKKADGTIDLEKTPFVVVGVHTPEFVFEKSQENVAAAIARHKLTYPVAQDNDYATWNAFANHYWPAKYLIDADGYIRYEHFGEGAYDETDTAIAALLKEMHVAVASGTVVMPADAGSRRDQTPETYIGTRSWSSLWNAQGDPMPGQATTYTAPEKKSLPLHHYALVGQWRLSDDQEYQTLDGITGEIRLHFLGAEANLVLGFGESERPVIATVTVDGKRMTSFHVDRHDLFQLYKGAYGEHDLVLSFDGAGVKAYAFTFGSN